MLSTVTMFLLGIVLYGSTALLPIFLQTLLGYNAMRAWCYLRRHRCADPVAGRRDAHVSCGSTMDGDAGGLDHLGVAISHGALQFEHHFQRCHVGAGLPEHGHGIPVCADQRNAFYFVKRDKVNNATGIMNLHGTSGKRRHCGCDHGVITPRARHQNIWPGT